MDSLGTTVKIRNEAHHLGFDGCGFARAEPLSDEARRLEVWLTNNHHGSMGWMENHFDKRTDPTQLVPGAKSVISLIASYHYPENISYDSRAGVPKIAKYARGRDYHKVFKSKLKKLYNYIREETGDINGRVFVDSAPVMDKAWAEKAGLGWVAKNTNLINRGIGSYILIGEIILDLDLIYDAPTTDHCGSCTRCIDACPTDALHEPYKIDGTRCISYLTIELKENIPEEFHKDIGEWMFGCDICQDVCPWNRKAESGRFDDLRPREKLFIPDIKEWEELSLESWSTLFEGSPVRRASYPKFRENVSIVAKNLTATPQTSYRYSGSDPETDGK